MSDDAAPPPAATDRGAPAVPRALGIDYGRKRIGIAATDAIGMAAHPVEVIHLPPGEPAAARIAELAEDREAEVLVVGMPFNMDGSEHKSAKEVRRFATLCGERCGLPVEFVDERLTTVEAERHQRRKGLRGRDMKRGIDMIAAAVLLGDWLDAARERTRSQRAAETAAETAEDAVQPGPGEDR